MSNRTRLATLAFLLAASAPIGAQELAEETYEGLRATALKMQREAREFRASAAATQPAGRAESPCDKVAEIAVERFFGRTGIPEVTYYFRPYELVTGDKWAGKFFHNTAPGDLYQHPGFYDAKLPREAYAGVVAAANTSQFFAYDDEYKRSSDGLWTTVAVSVTCEDKRSKRVSSLDGAGPKGLVDLYKRLFALAESLAWFD